MATTPHREFVLHLNFDVYGRNLPLITEREVVDLINSDLQTILNHKGVVKHHELEVFEVTPELASLYLHDRASYKLKAKIAVSKVTTAELPLINRKVAKSLEFQGAPIVVQGTLICGETTKVARRFGLHCESPPEYTATPLPGPSNTRTEDDRL
ncbi:hypothetical protein 3 [Beihai barnacle virus 7]|uniref:Uncharacterized protein n=1 Tax=Beihai barnacle virus 7 TaxID=1922365 RepID=A0A1L3KMQ8_9RHAB|nr:hypothetical protein 3 [Beihai barnacle virus 7]APG78664.1 hypothetical protein 3 [Beihai barnacle virus 7]